MASWRERIVAKLTPDVARLSVASDPDRLLLDEDVLQLLRERHVEVLSFEDPVSFRLDYESRYRIRWDRGEATEQAIIVRTSASDVATLPYDLARAEPRLRFSLAELFPGLSPTVLATLDRADLDPLDRAARRLGTERLGENATEDLVLHHCFGVDLALVRNPSDLLELLLRLHARSREIPRTIAARLIRVLGQQAALGDWPLETLVVDRDACRAFLAQSWPVFLERLAAGRPTTIQESGDRGVPDQTGPDVLPFDDARIRPFISSLFLEGALRPVRLSGSAARIPAWALVGIQRDPDADRRERLAGLVDELATALPKSEARYADWLSFARRWAELNRLRGASPSPLGPELAQSLPELQDRVDTAFLAWTEKRYAGLYNQPAIPVMVHQIPRALAQYRGETGHRPATETAHRPVSTGRPKLALLVLDGLAYDQWLTLRDVLAGQRAGYRFHERGVFAWIPTITSVSRQAIFSGKTPSQLAASLHTTAREASLWSQFWVDVGLARESIGYQLLPAADLPALGALDRLLDLTRCQVLGLVVRVVDEMVHGNPIGTNGMHALVHTWAEGGFLATLCDRLFDQGFSVFLTSDHGNIEAVGMGSPGEGAAAETRGERVRVYSTEIARQQVRSRFPKTIAWPPIGLPGDFLPLLATDRRAFIGEGTVTVAHGGISVAEVIVPFVRIERETR